MNFEVEVANLGDLIESYLRILECRRSGTIDMSEFPIDGPAGSEEEICKSVSQRIQKSYPWVTLTLTSSKKIELYGTMP